MDSDKRLAGKTVAMLVANGFAEHEMTDTQKALVAAGAVPKVVSPEIGLVNGWHEGTWGHNFYVEVKPGNVLPSQYDALLVPGGERSMASLLENAHARRIVKGMVDMNKPVGIVSDAVQLLARAEVLAGRTVSAPEQHRATVEAAGGKAAEAPVTVDGRLVTSAGGEHLPAFIDAFLDAVEGAASGEREAA
jgi:protease I